MKEKIKNLKEKKQSFDIIWNDSKNKSIIKLSLWFALILILSLVVRINGTETEEIKKENEIILSNPKKQLKEIKEYNINLNIETTETIEIINKKLINNQEIINYLGNNYYYDIETKENNITDEIIIKTQYFNPKNIFNLIEYIEEEYQTIYKDESYVANYKVPSNIFIKQYNGKETETNEFIDIKIEGKEKTNKITINLNNIDETINIKNIIIIFNNIEDIKEWNNGYNNLNSSNRTIRIFI